MKYPVHKKSGLPSTDFLYAAFGRHLNQRITFQIEPDEYQIKNFEELGLDLSKPVYASGIFVGFWKKPVLTYSGRPPNLERHEGPISVFIRIASMCYKQDDKEVYPKYDAPKDQSRHRTRSESQICAERIKGLGWNLNNAPQLGTQAS